MVQNFTSSAVADLASLQNVPLIASIMTWVYMVIGIVGILVNICVIFVITSSKQMRQHLPNLFLINQSVADLWSAVFIIAGVYKNARMKLYGFAGELVCRLWLSNMFLWLGFIASLYNLIALTIERYFEIVHPIQHKLMFNRRKAVIAIISVWVWSVIYNSLALVPESGLEGGVCYVLTIWAFPGAKVILGIFNLFVKMILPICIFSYAYLAMAKSLSKRTDQSTTSGTNAKSFLAVRRNVFKILACAVSIHVISWIVNQCLIFAYAFGYALDFTSILYNVALAAVYLSTCANPVIYVLKYQRFRVAMRQAFCGKKVDIEFIQNKATASTLSKISTNKL